MTKQPKQAPGDAYPSKGGLDEVRRAGLSPGFRTFASAPTGQGIAWGRALLPISAWFLVIPRPRRSTLPSSPSRGKATENP
jgi:hypothetical protein